MPILADLCRLGILLLNVADGRENPPAAATKPLTPAATTSIAGNPDSFIGLTVTVTASVGRVISSTRFAVDQDPKAIGTGEVLVLVEYEAGWEGASQQVLSACREFNVSCGYPATEKDVELRLKQGFSVFIINWDEAGFRTVEIGRKAPGR